MKYIQVPEPIVIKNPETLEPYKTPDGQPVPAVDFALWLRQNLLSSEAFSDGWEGPYYAGDLASSFRDKEAGSVVPVEDAAHTRLLDALKKAKWAKPLLAAQWRPFMRAVKDPLDEVPQE